MADVIMRVALLKSDNDWQFPVSISMVNSSLTKIYQGFWRITYFTCKRKYFPTQCKWRSKSERRVRLINAHRECWTILSTKGNGVRVNCKDGTSEKDLRSSVWQDFLEDISPGKKRAFLSQSINLSKILHVLLLEITSVQWIVAIQNFTLYFYFKKKKLKTELFLTWQRKQCNSVYVSSISYHIINK